MKQSMKYCLLGLLCLLLEIMAMSVHPFVNDEATAPKVSYIISQKDATHNAVRFLYYIYTNTPREAVSVDNPSLNLKVVIKQLSDACNGKDKAKSVYSLDKSVYAYLHPDPIGYYVYALEKIVI